MLADLGAGDGGTLWPLDHAGLVGETIYAVDISAEHVALCERLSPKVKGIVSDVAQVEELADASVDAVVSSQVIEHLPDDRVLAPEIARLLRAGRLVLRRERDPRPARVLALQGQAARARAVAARSDAHARVRVGATHFRAVLEHPQLEFDVVRSNQLKFPLTDFMFRVAAVAHLVKRERLPELYLDLPRWVARARRATGIPIPGYRWVEATGRKRAASS